MIHFICNDNFLTAHDELRDSLYFPRIHNQSRWGNSGWCVGRRIPSGSQSDAAHRREDWFLKDAFVYPNSGWHRILGYFSTEAEVSFCGRYCGSSVFPWVPMREKMMGPRSAVGDTKETINKIADFGRSPLADQPCIDKARMNLCGDLHPHHICCIIPFIV